MSYKIAFLNDEDFERLPMQDSHTKLGVAYPEYGEAYVRKSGSNLVDVFSAMHELEHLQGKDHGEHYDSENKCYYKDGGSWMQTLGPLAMMIPGLQPVGIGMELGGGAMHNQAMAKQQKQSAGQQNQMMNQFGSPQGSSQMPMGQGAPNVSQSGGSGGGSGSGGSIGGGLAPMTSASGAMQGNQFNPYNPFGQNAGGPS